MDSESTDEGLGWAGTLLSCFDIVVLLRSVLSGKVLEGWNAQMDLLRNAAVSQRMRRNQ